MSLAWGRGRAACLTIFLLAGCSGAGVDPPASVDERATALATSSRVDTTPAGRSTASAGCLPDCAGGRAYDAQAYDLRAHFDWTSKRLIASERITLALLDASQPIVELDSAVEVTRVHAHGIALPFASDAAAKTLRVDLSELHRGRRPVTFTVEYQAASPSSAPIPSLLTASGRDGDPVTSRVVFTDSEPDRGVYWLVANHHPADRARWSVELTVAPDEDVIANGERVKDERCGGQRVVRYEIEEPLPTYLMAFAAGQLEHRDRKHGRVPLSVWYRRGLLIDAEQNLDVVADAMGTFEKLMGPYPWKRYSVVLLPDFGGGMENATITFNIEPSGQGTVNFILNAHELGHHWWGDWVTMHDYDDVWIKEGMATLLESEADRARRDSAGSGRLFGFDFSFYPDDAIRDKSLHGFDKYTSGPYQRAAWLLTQIRATVGEQVFWKTLRRLLQQHALDSIDSETFVRGFAPALDEATIQKILGTLDLKPTPAVAISAQYNPDSTAVTLTLTDPSNAIIAPPRLSVVDAAGQAAPAATLEVGVPLTLTIPVGGYLASDEQDVHPDWAASFTVDENAFYSDLAPLYLPSAPTALAAWEGRSPAQQERALWYAYPWWLQPNAFADLYGQLDSTYARNAAETTACSLLRFFPTLPTEENPWIGVLGPILQKPALLRYQYGYAGCGTTLATRYFGAELAQTAAALDTHNAGRFAYLLGFDYGAQASFDALWPVAANGPSLRLREQALSRLTAEANGSGGFSPLPSDQVPAWQAFYRARLEETTSASHFNTVWRGIKALKDAAALALVGPKLHSVPLNAATQRQVVCDANALAPSAAAWADFQAAAQPWSTLSPAAQAVLSNPAACTQPQPLVAKAPGLGGPLADRPDAHVGEPRTHRTALLHP